MPPESMSPFPAFRFEVVFREESLGGQAGSDDIALCRGAFSECSGLEASMEPKEINEGGRNYGVAQRQGRVTFANVVFKRGLTANRDLWSWFALVSRGASAYRLTATVTVRGPDTAAGAASAEFQWKLLRCLPVKFKVPTLNATATDIAVEELHIAHEGLELIKQGGAR
jgi:phage tail-like protein